MARLTPSQRTWHTFRQNKFALAGLIFIVLVCVFATLGYLIMPDDTPLANNQTIQLSLKKPGALFTMLHLKKPERVDTVGLLAKLQRGQSAFYNDIPITAYRFKNDSIYVDEYVGSEDKPEARAYNIFEVITGQKPVYKNNTVTIENANGTNTTLLRQQTLNGRFYANIKQNNIASKRFWLGTDLYGRDIFSRLILGARVSLSVGIMAVIISLVVGVGVGAIAGYFGGWADNVLSWLMNILWSLPALLLVIAISFALGKGLWQIFLAVGLSMWVEVARLVRGQVISLKQKEFIEAARSLGYNNLRIITGHILPNIAGPIMVMASANFASAILLEAGLSFLGFGAQPPTPTWGGMIRDHYGYIIMDSAYLSLIPGVAIMLIVYAFNIITVGLRDAFDIKSQNIRI